MFDQRILIKKKGLNIKSRFQQEPVFASISTQFR